MLSRLPRRQLTPADYDKMERKLPHVRQEPRLVPLGSQPMVVRQFKLSIRKPNGEQSVVRCGYFENKLILAQNARGKPLSVQDNTVQNLAQQSPALAKAIQAVSTKHPDKAYYDQIFATVDYELS